MEAKLRATEEERRKALEAAAREKEEALAKVVVGCVSIQTIHILYYAVQSGTCTL